MEVMAHSRLPLSPPSAPQSSLTLSVLNGNAYGVAGDLAHGHFLFNLRAQGKPGDRPRMPLNIALVLDRSGSMEGEPMDYAKRACAYVVDLLEPQDILSIVTFDKVVEVILPARRVANKALVKDYINRITPGSGANLYDGLLAGCEQVTALKTAHTLNRVLFLTDGEPTVGIRDPEAITDQAALQRGRGISLSAMGFGPKFNENLLSGIARRSGGNYYYIGRPELIPEIFRRELDILMRTTARNLKMRLSLSRGVTVRHVEGQQPVFGARTAEVNLIDVEQGAGLSSLWELEVMPRPAGTYRLAVAELHYDDSATGRREVLTADVIQEFTTDRRRIGTGVEPQVQSEIEVAHAARSLEASVRSFINQQIDRSQVIQELNRTKSLMLDQGKLAEAQQITQAMQAIQSGGSVEKTLLGTIYTLDQGKTR